MKEETLGERIFEALSPIPRCGICGKPRPRDMLTCEECDEELRKIYLKEMEEDFEIEHQCHGCGKWIKGDDPFCSEECFNTYMDRQYLIKQAEQREKTRKLLGGKI